MARGAWCDFLDFHTNVPDGLFSSGCHDRIRPFLQRYHKLSVLGSVMAALGGWLTLVAVSSESHVLTDAYPDYLANGYNPKLVEYLIFGLRLPKRCLQKVSYSDFGSLDPFYNTEFIFTRLKGTELCDWMMSQSGLRRALITEELSMLSLLEIVSNIVGVWPPIVAYLKKTGSRTDGDNLVV